MQNYAANYEDVENKVVDNLRGKNWLAAFGMLMLYGLVGGHRFYTGKTGSAIAMLILSVCIVTLPVTIIWWFVDLLMLATNNFKHADGSELYEQVNWLAWIVVIFAVLYVSFWVVTLALTAGAAHTPVAP